MSSAAHSPAPSQPGVGIIELIQLPNNSSALRTVRYQYPLKLIAPAPQRTSHDNTSVQTLYLLSYGGGLVAGDRIAIVCSLDTSTRLTLLTQGCTKIFKAAADATDDQALATQDLRVVVGPAAALCYLPDPVQPFRQSVFGQKQSYEVVNSGGGGCGGSVCALDWVSRGRAARGEDWDFRSYSSRNEVWQIDDNNDNNGKDTGDGRQRVLLLRDNLSLCSSAAATGSIAARMDGMGVTGTLILHGPMMAGLAGYFQDEFKLLPRLGSRTWGGDAHGTKDESNDVDAGIKRARKARQDLDDQDRLLWTVSCLRGCTVVKFGAREVAGAKRWLHCMLEVEGSIARSFGERALLCLR